MPADIIAIVTARNEADRLAATLQGLARAFPGARLWVADDGSTDETPMIAAGAGARLVRSETPVGKGAAATAAARAALREAGPTGEGARAPIFILCDGDLGASAAVLGGLTGAISRDQAELVVAVFARRVGGGFGLVVKLARWAIRRRSGLSVLAPISGQRALTAEALGDVLPFAGGFGMEIAMTLDALHAGHRLAEVELDLSHRATGRSPAGFLHRARQLLDIRRALSDRPPPPAA
jgi:glycosyltransferase involved in cell wall biosynthesis